MQTTHTYDYPAYKYAHKEAKKLRNAGQRYVWMIIHPRTGRHVLVLGDSIEDKPTRVRVDHEYYCSPPREPNQREMDRDNLVWMANQALQNEENSELAQAILEYLENYDA